MSGNIYRESMTSATRETEVLTNRANGQVLPLKYQSQVARDVAEGRCVGPLSYSFDGGADDREEEDEFFGLDPNLNGGNDELIYNSDGLLQLPLSPTFPYLDISALLDHDIPASSPDDNISLNAPSNVRNAPWDQVARAASPRTEDRSVTATNSRNEERLTASALQHAFINNPITDLNTGTDIGSDSNPYLRDLIDRYAFPTLAAFGDFMEDDVAESRLLGNLGAFTNYPASSAQRAATSGFSSSTNLLPAREIGVPPYQSNESSQPRPSATSSHSSHQFSSREVIGQNTPFETYQSAPTMAPSLRPTETYSAPVAAAPHDPTNNSCRQPAILVRQYSIPQATSRERNVSNSFYTSPLPPPRPTHPSTFLQAPDISSPNTIQGVYTSENTGNDSIQHLQTFQRNAIPNNHHTLPGNNNVGDAVATSMVSSYSPTQTYRSYHSNEHTARADPSRPALPTESCMKSRHTPSLFRRLAATPAPPLTAGTNSSPLHQPPTTPSMDFSSNTPTSSLPTLRQLGRKVKAPRMLNAPKELAVGPGQTIVIPPDRWWPKDRSKTKKMMDEWLDEAMIDETIPIPLFWAESAARHVKMQEVAEKHAKRKLIERQRARRVALLTATADQAGQRTMVQSNGGNASQSSPLGFPMGVFGTSESTHNFWGAHEDDDDDDDDDDNALENKDSQRPGTKRGRDTDDDGGSSSKRRN